MGEASGKVGNRAAGKMKRWPMIVGIVAFVALVVVLAVFASYRMGLIVPGDAAAKYAGDGYISESTVSDYVTSYRRQQGLEGSGDEAWASFLVDNDLDPNSLRLQTIQQLTIDEMVKRKAAELGVAVDEAEFQEYLDTFKGNLAFGDDEIYRSTLEMQGQTVEQAEQGFRNLFLQRALFEAAVPVPEPTDEETRVGLKRAYPSGIDAKHIYRFTIKGLDEGSSYDRIEAVQKVRARFLGGELAPAAFESFVVEESNDDELVARKGDDGWSIDSASHGSEYQDALEGLAENEVSSVFVDDDGYSFLWVDRTYSLKPDDGGEYDLSVVPDDLLQAVKDGIGKVYWQLDCQVYLQQLLDESNLEVYPMPADVPYNVDMSLADAQLEEVSG